MNLKQNDNAKAILILGLIVLSAYAPILFLGHSYNQSSPLPLNYLGYQGKPLSFNTTIDPGADYIAIQPLLKLATKLFSEGIIPLWNPYLGGGTPLAADTIAYVFSPVILGFFLPTILWDYVLLILIGTAGFLTFLFLRNLRINFTASIVGGTFYMLSGAFTWYIAHTDIPVIAFTPFILYSIEKVIQNKNPKSIILLSISLLFSFLGAHLESIVLQLLLVAAYTVYRVTTILSNHKQDKISPDSSNNSESHHNVRSVLIWLVIGFIGGVGLTSFFFLPVYEFVQNSYLSHTSITGLAYDPPYVPVSIFVPYILGTIHTYWSEPIANIANWNSLGGYVGGTALFFSIVGIVLSIKHNNNFHKYTPLFFMCLSSFFIMKTVGVPVINWIGYIPGLSFVVFTRYSGIIVPLGFAISSAFAIDLLGKHGINKNHLIFITLVSISIILLLSIPLLSYLLPHDAKFDRHISQTDAKNYVSFQIIQSVLFIISSCIFFFAYRKQRSTIVVVIPLILLELLTYVPMGLSPVWLAYKGIIILSGSLSVSILSLKLSNSQNLNKSKRIWYAIIVITIAIIFSNIMIVETSPASMLNMHDPYVTNPVTEFLKKNIGDSRMFSFDFTLGPNYPASYEINTIGIMDAMNIDSFYSFNHNFLDQNAWTSNLGYPSWTQSYGPAASMVKFFENKKYFDFLGVKYILTQGYDLGNLSPGPSQTSQFERLDNQNSIGQSFISPYNTISYIGVSHGTYLQINHGNIEFTIDSVPYDKQFHRETIFNAEHVNNANFNNYKIDPPITNALGKKFYFSLKYPDASNDNKMTIFTYEPGSGGFNIIKQKLGGQFFRSGVPVNDTEMVFSIGDNGDEYPLVFKFHDINIQENKQVFPRAFLVNRFISVNTNGAQQFLLGNPNFDMRKYIILEQDLPSDASYLLKSTELDNDSTAQITSYGPNIVTIHTSSNEASLLVLTDNYYPGWKATVDGKDTPIYKTDGLVRSVFVPAGQHIVIFSYFPTSFLTGLIISSGTAVFLICIVLICDRNRLKRGIH